MIPSLYQYDTDYTFATPQYSLGGQYNNCLSLVAKEELISGISLDGEYIEPSDWTAIDFTPPLATIDINVTDGTHRVRHNVTTKIFGAFLYGYQVFESYAYCAGTRLAPINEVDIYVMNLVIIGMGQVLL